MFSGVGGMVQFVCCVCVTVGASSSKVPLSDRIMSVTLMSFPECAVRCYD